jgi:hypothetical protein
MNVNKKMGNQNYWLPTKLTFASRLEYTWRVAPQHCPLPIIQLNKSETTDSILILFPKKNQPPKCPLERKSSNPASKMSITPERIKNFVFSAKCAKSLLKMSKNSQPSIIGIFKSRKIMSGKRSIEISPFSSFFKKSMASNPL